MGVRIVLVEPAGALNVGSIARVMKNMALTELVLVNPKCDRLSEEAVRMAVHARDVLENALVVDTLPAALKGCQRAIATTARTRGIPTKLESPRTALPWLLGENFNSALIFGSEERGLSNEELNYGQRFIRIPSSSVYPSLNLAQAVAVCAYELYQASLPQDIDNSPSSVNLQEDNSNQIANAPIEALEAYYQDLETVLLDIGYLYPHTVKARMEKFRRLYNKANLNQDEVSMLRGILRQIKWAMSKYN
ncbi:MAG: RNA methyltransferase [Xenococcaceae cyanobacterium MO_207.B15]|nr:RNA methyltransferase [Xenococcaceae cyanobacterium MO_207.B15]